MRFQPLVLNCAKRLIHSDLAVRNRCISRVRQLGLYHTLIQIIIKI